MRKQQPAHRQVLIELRPVNPYPAADEPQVSPLLRCRVPESRKPFDGNLEPPTVLERHAHHAVRKRR